MTWRLVFFRAFSAPTCEAIHPATAAPALGLFANLHKRPDLKFWPTRKYGQAIHMLQEAFQDPNAPLTDGTLEAIALKWPWVGSTGYRPAGDAGAMGSDSLSWCATGETSGDQVSSAGLCCDSIASRLRVLPFARPVILPCERIMSFRSFVCSFVARRCRSAWSHSSQLQLACSCMLASMHAIGSGRHTHSRVVCSLSVLPSFPGPKSSVRQRCRWPI